MDEAVQTLAQLAADGKGTRAYPCQVREGLVHSPRMKDGLHPAYTHSTKVTCACGASFVTGSTVEDIRVEICSNCHPFYTGTQKLIDTAGRVDRYKRLAGHAKTAASTRKPKAPRRKKTPRATA